MNFLNNGYKMFFLILGFQFFNQVRGMDVATSDALKTMNRFDSTPREICEQVSSYLHLRDKVNICSVHKKAQNCYRAAFEKEETSETEQSQINLFISERCPHYFEFLQSNRRHFDEKVLPVTFYNKIQVEIFNYFNAIAAESLCEKHFPYPC